MSKIRSALVRLGFSLNLSLILLPHTSAYAACPDWDHNGRIEPADISSFVSRWFSGNGDFDGNGLTEPADVSLFVSSWHAALNGQNLCDTAPNPVSFGSLGTALTNSSEPRSVSILAASNDSVSHYRAVKVFSSNGDPSCPATLSGSDVVISTPYLLTFESGSGKYRICAQGRTQQGTYQTTVSQSNVVTVDSTPPAISFLSPAENQRTNGRNFSVNVACESSGTTVYLYPHPGAWSEAYIPCPPTQQITIPISLGNLSPGNFLVSVDQWDGAGNLTVVSRNFVYDRAGPDIHFISPAEYEVTNGQNFSVTVSCEFGGSTVYLYPRPGAWSEAYIPCPSSQQVTIPIQLSSIPQGPFFVAVDQWDAVGNVTAVSRYFSLDNAPPIVQITSPGDNTSVGRTFAINGSCQYDGQHTYANIISIYVDSEASLGAQTQCQANNRFSSALTLLDAADVPNGDGSHWVRAKQTDAAGNVGLSNKVINIYRDTRGPRVRISFPKDNTAISKQFTLRGSCEHNSTIGQTEANHVEIFINSSVLPYAVAQCESDNGFSASITLSGNSGSQHWIEAWQADGTANWAASNRVTNLTLQTSTPVLEFITPSSGTISTGAVSVNLRCDPNAQAVVLHGDIVLENEVAGTLVVCNSSGQASTTLTLTPGSDGPRILSALEFDAAGNEANSTVSVEFRSSLPDATTTAPFPYVKVAALENYKITFQDGSQSPVRVIPDINIAQILYQTYLNAITRLNFEPHLALSKTVGGPFAACAFAQNYFPNPGFEPFDLPENRNGKIKLWRNISEIFASGIQADQSAWLEAAKRAQTYIAKMKRDYGAITKHELNALSKVTSTSFVGQFMPISALKIEDFWYAHDNFSTSEDVIPVFGERDRSETLLEKVILYNSSYIKNELGQAVNSDVQNLQNAWQRHSGHSSTLPLPDTNFLINEVTAESISATEIDAWFKRLPFKNLMLGVKWYELYRYRYCLPSRTTPDQWMQSN